MGRIDRLRKLEQQIRAKGASDRELLPLLDFMRACLPQQYRHDDAKLMELRAHIDAGQLTEADRAALDAVDGRDLERWELTAEQLVIMLSSPLDAPLNF